MDKHKTLHFSANDELMVTPTQPCTDSYKIEFEAVLIILRLILLLFHSPPACILMFNKLSFYIFDIFEILA